MLTHYSIISQVPPQLPTQPLTPVWQSVLVYYLTTSKFLGQLTLSENFGLGIPAAKDLNSGVTWIGELNSVLDNAETTWSVFVPSRQDGNISPATRLDISSANPTEV